MRKLLMFMFILGATFSAVAAFAQGLEDVAAEASKAVVAIEGYKKAPVFGLEIRIGETVRELVVKKVGESLNKVSSGSGFYITEDGYILTNKHVVPANGSTYKVYDGERRVDVEIIYRDPRYDLAVLKVEGEDLPFIRLSDESAEIGDEVASVGNALGQFVDTVSSGEVLSLDEDVVATGDGIVEVLEGVIATNTQLFPGDSGGPLLNSRGEAVGVNVALVSGTDVGFSIPSDVTRSVVKKAGVGI